MDRRPLVAASCAWVAGASLWPLCPGNTAVPALAGLLLLVAALTVAGRMSPKLATACALAIALAYGERRWLEQRSVSDLPLPAEADINASAELVGILISEVEVDGDLAAFRMRAETIKLVPGEAPSSTNDTVAARIRLLARQEQDEAAAWRRGDRVRLTGTLELPGEAGNFGAFDYREYLAKQGVFRQFSVKGLANVEHAELPGSLTVKAQRTLDEFRKRIGLLSDRLYPRGDSGYMKGLVVGIRSDLDPVQFDQFARLGLTHVLAISGLHVGVVVYLLLKLFGWLRLTRERGLELTIAAMPAYMMITGASPSAVRACLMAMIALWLSRIHALKDGLHLLCAAAVAMLVWNPRLIEDVGCQLSFLVTAGLILFVPTVASLLPARWWGWLKSAIAVTVTAQVVSFPVSVYYFHSLHLLSLPANFALVPFISVIVMPLGMAALALGGVWLPLGLFPAKLASYGNDLTFLAVDRLNAYVELRTIWPQPGLPWVAAAYALMGLGLAGVKRMQERKRDLEWWSKEADRFASGSAGGPDTVPLAANGASGPEAGPRLRSVLRQSAYALACLVWLLAGVRPAWTDRSATVSFLNVGQGDSVLIRTGAGKHVLVDAGGTLVFRKPGEEWKERSDPYEVGRKLLVPLLLQRGVKQLDALVLTHLDEDHIGGARAVLDNVPVRALIFNGTAKNSPGALGLLDAVADRGIPVYAARAPNSWRPDSSAVFGFLYPDGNALGEGGAAGVPVRDGQNDLSVSMIATLYGRAFLLSGDLEAKGEEAVIETEHAGGDVRRGTIDVMKAGHHGSKTSSTALWVDYWRPAETVVSVGRNNFYGHPNADVVRRLEEAGSRVRRTDLDGEVQYRIEPDGELRGRTMRDTSAGSGQ